eukprot:scaffold28142_cov23-Tisochrysis_lutea.AAC.2
MGLLSPGAGTLCHTHRHLHHPLGSPGHLRTGEPGVQSKRLRCSIAEGGARFGQPESPFKSCLYPHTHCPAAPPLCLHTTTPSSCVPRAPPALRSCCPARALAPCRALSRAPRTSIMVDPVNIMPKQAATKKQVTKGKPEKGEKVSLFAPPDVAFACGIEASLPSHQGS